jgi:hypothetical protein
LLYLNRSREDDRIRAHLLRRLFELGFVELFILLRVSIARQGVDAGGAELR